MDVNRIREATSRAVLQRSVSHIAARSLGVAWVLCVVTLPLCFGCRREPPDLTACTRLDVQYGNGALDYFFPGTSMQGRILNEEERAYIGSFDKWTVADEEQIKAFAHPISQGTYRGRHSGVCGCIPVDVIGYKGNDRVTSFRVHSSNIVTKNKRRFAYPPGVLSLESLIPPGIKPLKARWDCAVNLNRLIFGGLWVGRNRRPYPDPDQWCDVIVEACRRQTIIYADQDNKEVRAYPDMAIARGLACPSVHEATDVNAPLSRVDKANSSSQTPDRWISDYAMNSHCTKDSPKDTVFLFESKPGWNQHGGPELFVFDNHDPRGGCVMLSDGSVRFIRSEEELKQLRWK